MEFTIFNNREAKQYQVQVEDAMARVEYILAKDKIYLTHTEVPSSLEGQGIGSKMVQQVLEDIQTQGLTLVPLCPFVALYLKKHPQWKKLVLKGIRVE